MVMKRSEGGFTLIEVMVAIALMGVAVYILLNSHMASLWLFDSTENAVRTTRLVEQAIGRAEIEIMAGNLSGNEEFGPRHPEFTYTWDAQLNEFDQNIPLYDVRVTVQGPNVEEQAMFRFYNVVL